MKSVYLEEKELEAVTYSGTELSRLSEKELVDIAHCYASVFNQSWREKWTEASVLEEVREVFTPKEGREPLATIIWKQEKAIGFAWGVLTDIDHLIAERDMPFSLPSELKHEGIEKAKLWLRKVAHTSRVFLYREFGCLSEYKGRMASPLTLEILNKARENDCKVLLLWTSIQSRVFDLGVGARWFPIHFFTPSVNDQDLVLMVGNIESSYRVIKMGSSDDPKEVEAGYKELFGNLDDYKCRS
jgi:hypothetical protein